MVNQLLVRGFLTKRMDWIGFDIYLDMIID